MKVGVGVGVADWVGVVVIVDCIFRISAWSRSAAVGMVRYVDNNN